MADTATLQSDIRTRIYDRLADTLGPRKVQLWLNGQTRIALVDDAATLRVTVPSRFVADRLRTAATAAALQDAATAECGPGTTVAVEVADDTSPAIPTAATPDQADDASTPASTSSRGLSSAKPRIAPTSTPTSTAPTRTAAPRKPIPHPFADSGLRHRLEDLVVGSCNEVVVAAAVRLAEADPADATICGVPLFIHGGCGLGKTHTLQGICRRWLQRKPGTKVLYTTGEQFTNRYIDHAQRGKLGDFRKKMRSIDLLCIDDVHFIAGKSKTQTEFLHCFDAIELCGAPIVLASDQHPRMIKQFGEALTSRCLRGLVVEVEKPDEATRRELVVALAARKGMVIPVPAVGVLAMHVGQSVREIEGALTKLHALASLRRTGNAPAVALPVDMAMVDRLVAAEQRETPTRPATVPGITRAVAEAFGFSPRQVLSRARQRPLVLARSLVVRLAKELTHMSYPEIASAMGRPSHSSVITADKRIKQLVADAAEVEVPGRLEPTPVTRLIDELKRTIRLADAA